MNKQHQRRIEALNRAWENYVREHFSEDTPHYDKAPLWFERIFNDGYLAGYEEALLE